MNFSEISLSLKWNVNPVRRSSTFQREGSHGALNPVFAPKGILSSSPLQAPIEAELRTGQAAGLSNGVKWDENILLPKSSILE